MKKFILLLLLCASSAFAQDLRPSAYLGLPGKITVRGGKILGASGGVTTIAETTITPTDDATTYVYIDLSGTPTLSTSTSAFPGSSYFPICTVIKSHGLITSFTDNRPDSFMAGGGSSAVSSVFSRTGAVVAAANDYTLNQVGNPVAAVSFQPTVDASVLLKQFNGTNAVDIFHIQNKTANELFRVDSAGTLRFWDGTCSLSNGSLFCGGGTSVGASTYVTASNCSSSASPAVCGSAAAGSVAVPTGTNPTLTVNTTAVTANSQIFVQSDDTLGTKLSVTCNSTLASLAVEPVISTRVAATSFTITISGVISTNPVCLSYFIVN